MMTIVRAIVRHRWPPPSCSRRRRAGAALSQPPDPRAGDDPAGRRAGHLRAHAGAEPERDAGLVGGDREPPRRQRQHRVRAVAKSTPDGYTLLLHADSGITINPHVYGKLPFDALKDLLPVASVATNQFMLSLNPQVPAKTFQEFIEYARKTKPPLPYASGGNGSQHQLMMEMLKQRAKIDLLHVPFRGAAPATTATVAGDTKVLFSGSASASLIQAGQLRAVATSGKKRAAALPRPADHRRVLSGLRGRHLARPVRAGRHAGADRDAAAHRGAQAPVRRRVRQEAQRLRQPRAAGAVAGGVLQADPRGLREIRHRSSASSASRSTEVIPAQSRSLRVNPPAAAAIVRLFTEWREFYARVGHFVAQLAQYVPSDVQPRTARTHVAVPLGRPISATSRTESAFRGPLFGRQDRRQGSPPRQGLADPGSRTPCTQPGCRSPPATRTSTRRPTRP